MKELIWRSAPREVKRWASTSIALRLRVGTKHDFEGENPHGSRNRSFLMSCKVLQVFEKHEQVSQVRCRQPRQETKPELTLTVCAQRSQLIYTPVSFI